jgi:ATP-dependent Clp protease protease subunit
MNEKFMPREDEEAEEGREEGGGSLAKKLLRTRSILVSEVITDKLARRMTTQALLLQEDDPKKPITVYINSPGGSADSGFAMYDILRFIRPPVRTVVTGLCASAAVLVYLSVSRERRFSLPNGRFLLHQPSTAVSGSASDIEINAEEILRLKDRYNTIVAEETGKSLQQVTKDADRDFWLGAPQAKEYGLVGKIVKVYDELDR